jgi:small-conductance mechanosensitive channel
MSTLAAALIAIAFVVLLRPYIPTLPFKIGNTVEIGGLIGKVEAMTFNYTRMRTFDGKTLFVPNQMLFKSIINNYHFTPTRRVRVKVTIGYKDDLVKAKEVIKQLMIDDERVLKKPAPSVYVMELADNGVNLSARCWVENTKYLRVLSDVTEKLKLRFDEEGRERPGFPLNDPRHAGAHLRVVLVIHGHRAMVREQRFLVLEQFCERLGPRERVELPLAAADLFCAVSWAFLRAS